MDNGQAEGPETIDDLAAFLVDNPDADGSGTAKEDKQQNSEVPDEDNTEEEETDPAEDDPEEEEESEDAKERPSLKFKVPVKGEDGTDQEIEVDEKELVAGYQRHADYTRKTQELANKEREITQVVGQKLTESQTYYMQQAQMAHAAVRHVAGLKTPEQMEQLAMSDPAAWVQEQQRERAVNGLLTQLQQNVQRESAEQEQQRAQQKQLAYQQAWEVLTKEGIDKPALEKIFTTIQKRYDVPMERFQNLDDPKLVKIMRDAVAYQELKDKKAVVTKKVQDAPKLPATRQSVPRDEQRAKALDKKFSTGKAKLDDLAELIYTRKL